MGKQRQKQASKSKQDVKTGTGLVDPDLTLLDEMKEAVESGERTYVVAADICFKIGEGELYKKLGKGYENLVQYFNEELGISKSKGYYFRDIGRMMSMYHIKRDVATKIGWSKLKELAKVITPDNRDDLLKKAEMLNIDTIQEEVKRIKTQSGGTGGATKGDPEEYMRVAFKFLESEHKLIQSALEVAKGELGDSKHTDRMGFLLSHICDQWLSDPSHYEVGPLDARIRHLEERFDIKLMVVPKEEMADENPEEDMDTYQGDDDNPIEFDGDLSAGLDQDDQQAIEDIMSVAGRTNPDFRYTL